jgi:hypothetical protein
LTQVAVGTEVKVVAVGNYSQGINPPHADVESGRHIADFQTQTVGKGFMQSRWKRGGVL